MKTRSKIKKSHRIQVYFEVSEYEYFKQEAKRNNTTISKVIRDSAMEQNSLGYGMYMHNQRKEKKE